MFGHTNAPHDASYKAYGPKSYAKKVYPATPAQIAYVEKLAKDLGIETPTVLDKKDATATIEALKAERQAKWDAERAAKKAEEADAMEGVSPWPAARVKISGEIVFAKDQVGDFGPVTKIRVKDEDGRTVWMTCPKSLLETHTSQELLGKHVSGAVTLKPKDDEPWFAYGSRPAGFGFKASK